MVFYNVSYLVSFNGKDMNTALIYLMLTCPVPKMVNLTKYPWNKNDLECLDTCVKHCPENYSDSPCLIRFVKKDERDYYCECGSKR